MGLNIKLKNGLLLRSRRKVISLYEVKKKKNTCEEYESSLADCTTLEQIFSRLIYYSVSQSECKTLEEMKEIIESVKEEIKALSSIELGD